MVIPMTPLFVPFRQIKFLWPILAAPSSYLKYPRVTARNSSSWLVDFQYFQWPIQLALPEWHLESRLAGWLHGSLRSLGNPYRAGKAWAIEAPIPPLASPIIYTSKPDRLAEVSALRCSGARKWSLFSSTLDDFCVIAYLFVWFWSIPIFK